MLTLLYLIFFSGIAVKLCIKQNAKNLRIQGSYSCCKSFWDYEATDVNAQSILVPTSTENTCSTKVEWKAPV